MIPETPAMSMANFSRWYGCVEKAISLTYARLPTAVAFMAFYGVCPFDLPGFFAGQWLHIHSHLPLVQFAGLGALPGRACGITYDFVW